MAIFVGCALVFAAVAGQSVPPLFTVVTAVAATAICALAPRLAQLEERFAMGRGGAAAMLTFAIILPIALTSASFSYWMIEGGLPYYWGVATLVSLIAVTTALLGNRLAHIFAGKAACWSVFAAMDGSLNALGAMGAGIAVMVLITRYQAPVRREPPPYSTAFCSRCGSPVPDPPPGSTWFEIAAGTLDGDPGVRPDRHIFVEHRAAWYEIADDLPQLDEPALREHRSGGRR